MEENGYSLTVEDVENISSVHTRYQVPVALQSCHIAIVDGYIIEGHVSIFEIERLLTERPEILGLSVPGMPIGSPGMEVEGATPQPYNVIAFDKTGKTEVYASYPK